MQKKTNSTKIFIRLYQHNSNVLFACLKCVIMYVKNIFYRSNEMIDS